MRVSTMPYGVKILNKTKIVGTVGPSSSSTEMIEKIYLAGIKGVRINTAYGTTTLYKQIVDNVRSVGEIPIIVDIKGPEIRINAKKKRTVHEGEVFDVGFEGQ